MVASDASGARRSDASSSLKLSSVGSFVFPLCRRRVTSVTRRTSFISRFTTSVVTSSSMGSDDEIDAGGEGGASFTSVDADVDALLSSVKTTTTWGGDWAEFVIFLARLQAMGYSGASADVVPSAGNGGDSKVPEWARGVSGGAKTIRSAPASEEEDNEEEEDLTPTDSGEIKRLALSFCRDRPDLYARLPERLVYQLIDWPIARSMNNRKLNAGVQRLRQSLDMDPSHLRGKCSACDKIQERQANPALQLSDLMRVLLALSEIDDPEEYAELPPKEAASEVIRRLLRAADSPKPSPENMPVDTSTVSIKSTSSDRRRRFDDGGGRGRGRGRGRDEGGRGRGRGRDYDSWDGDRRNRRFGEGGGDFNRREGGFDRRRDEYRGGGGGGGWNERPPRYDNRDDRNQRGEFGSRFSRSDGGYDAGERGGGRGGFDRRRDEYRGGGGGRNERRPRYDDRDDRNQRGEFGSRFNRSDDGRASFRNRDGFGEGNRGARDRFDDTPRGEHRRERPSYDNEGFRRPSREPRRSFDDRGDSNFNRYRDDEGFGRRFDDSARRRDTRRPGGRREWDDRGDSDWKPASRDDVRVWRDTDRRRD